MKTVFRRSISLILAVMMVITFMPAYAMAESAPDARNAQRPQVKTQPVTPTQVSDAVSKFTDALTKFCADTSEMSNVSAFLTRFGGLTSAASGVIGILQMSGVIKDPTREALSEILVTVKDIQTKISQMDAKLDDINKQLVSIAVRQEEKSRNSKATTMLKYWRDFNGDYCEPLDILMDEYNAKIETGIWRWWKQDHDEGVRLLFAKQGDGSYALTYSSAGYEEGFPVTADNGESVASEKNVAFPAEVLPATKSLRFNIDTYQDVYVKKLAESIETAAKANKIEGDAFYSEWNEAANEESKKSLCVRYAWDILNTQMYQIACDVMSDNHEWVTDVAAKYKLFCNNVLMQDSGVNAMLNAMYLTHGFEGEIKQDIQDFCDGMAVKAGIYGQFALTCAGQDSMMSLAKRQNVQALFADTVNNLYDKKDKALTGYDNYCYITGTRMNHDVIHADSTMTANHKNGGYRGYSCTDWTITVPNILDNVYAQVLFDQYKSLDHGKSSFSSYLKAYGAFPTDNWNKNIMTRYGGVKTFALSEGIPMMAGSWAGDYFTSWRYYNINTGNGSKVEDKYFHIHDKVVYDAFNMGTGTLAVEQTAAARALYGEDHWNWTNDEVATFQTYSCLYRHNTGSGYDTEISRVNFNVMRLTPVHNLNGDNDPENPFLAFDSPTLTRGVSDYIGPDADVKDNRKVLTSITLKSGSFPYTGKAIRPAVTVKAGKKSVPAKNYKVSYMDNKAIGSATVTVEAKGKYTGTISRQFRIVPKGTKFRSLKRHGKSVKVKWKKQSAKMPTKRISGYQIRYSTNASMKNARTVKVKGCKKTSKRIKGLKKNKRYYFQIRTYMTAKDQRIYSRWSKKKSVKKA